MPKTTPKTTPKIPIDPARTIAVTALGVISPYGIGSSALEAGLLAGQSCLSPAAQVFPDFSGCVARVEALPAVAHPQRSSRSDRLAMAAAENACAGLDPELLRQSGVVMATTVAGLTELSPEVAVDPAAWFSRAGLACGAAYPISRVAAAVGEHLGVDGPVCAVSAACASGAVSLALAANMLLDGEVPLAIAGGSDALSEFTASGFHSLQSLDPAPCRPFDTNRQGLNLGEGAAVLILETLAHARARGAAVLALLRGWAMTNDAHHTTAPQPDGDGLAAAMRLAMEMAGVGVDEIGFVNAHGTGTPLNDAAETRCYEQVFRGRSTPIPVSSTKSYTGHCLGAAGALEAAIAILALRRGVLLPTLRLEDPIESGSVEYLRGPLRHQPIAAAISASAGFGGSNAALVFGKAETECSGDGRFDA